MARNQNRESSNKPVFQVRSGALSVSVWARQGNNGVFHSANAQRAYTEDDGKTWKHTDSFNRDDMPVIVALMQQAFAWIIREEAKAKSE